MNIAIIGLNSNLIQINNQEKIANYLKCKLYEIGESVSLISYFDNNLDLIKNVINQNFEVIFFLGNNLSIYNFNIKENLSRIFGDRLDKNNSCNLALKKYCEFHNITFSSLEEMDIMLPSNSIPLCNDQYDCNGFMYKHNNKYIVFLPNIYNFVVENYNNYILPLIKDISTSNLETMVIRCYGILEKDIKSIINEEIINTNISVQIKNDRLDNTIYLRYNLANSNNIQEVLSKICTKLNKFIYSMEDTDLYTTAQYLLSLHNKKLAIAETLTLGNITKKISLLDKNLITDSYLLTSYESLLRQIPVDNSIINNYGMYSVNTVYELTNKLLEKSTADICVFVLGELLLDTCYMAIGDMDGIHVYKNKINSSDDNLIDNISDTALFYIIKKLRQNDLQFR